MKKRFTEAQIIEILKKQEAGMKVAGVCRQHGIPDATLQLDGKFWMSERFKNLASESIRGGECEDQADAG